MAAVRVVLMNIRQLPAYYCRMPHRNPLKRVRWAVYCAWFFAQRGMWA